MSQLSTSSDIHHLLFSLLLDNILSFIYFSTSHPLQLAYLLFFSSYIFSLISFLFPLLLTTSIFLLLFLHSSLEANATSVGLLDQLGFMVVALVGNVFEWEFDTMGEFYKNLSLNCEVKEVLIESLSQNSKKSGILESSCVVRDHVALQDGCFLPDIPSKMPEFVDTSRTMGEFYQHLSTSCEVKEVTVEHLSQDFKRNGLVESNCGISDLVALEGCCFLPEITSRMPEFLDNSRTIGEFYQHLSINYQDKVKPVEIFSQNSRRSDLLELDCVIPDQVAQENGCFSRNIPSRIPQFLDNPRNHEDKEDNFGMGNQASLKEDNFEPENPSAVTENANNSPTRGADSEGRALDNLQSEFYNMSNVDCKVKEDQVRLLLENDRQSDISESHFGNGDQTISKSRSLKPSIPTRMAEKLNNSPSIGRKDHALESLQRDGSMRKEKEWKRTLACKLYEERMTFKLCEDKTVVDGAEDMDLLWEAYEADSSKTNKLKNNGKNGKNIEQKEEEEVDEEEEDDAVVQLCCLQALKLSTGKMALGVGRPNLMKISKVFKGMGLFRRRSKKGST